MPDDSRNGNPDKAAILAAIQHRWALAAMPTWQRAYQKFGNHLTPLRGKAAFIDGWPEHKLSSGEAQQYAREAHNVGLVAREGYGHLDLDTYPPALSKLLREHYEKYVGRALVRMRSGEPRGLVYRQDPNDSANRQPPIRLRHTLTGQSAGKIEIGLPMAQISGWHISGGIVDFEDWSVESATISQELLKVAHDALPAVLELHGYQIEPQPGASGGSTTAVETPIYDPRHRAVSPDIVEAAIRTSRVHDMPYEDWEKCVRWSNAASGGDERVREALLDATLEWAARNGKSLEKAEADFDRASSSHHTVSVHDATDALYRLLRGYGYSGRALTGDFAVLGDPPANVVVPQAATDQPRLDRKRSVSASTEERALAKLILPEYSKRFVYWQDKAWPYQDVGYFLDASKDDAEKLSHAFIGDWLQDHMEDGKAPMHKIRALHAHLAGLCRAMLPPGQPVFDPDPKVLLFDGEVAILPGMYESTLKTMTGLNVEPIKGGVTRCAPSPLFRCGKRIPGRLGHTEGVGDLDAFMARVEQTGSHSPALLEWARQRLLACGAGKPGDLDIFLRVMSSNLTDKARQKKELLARTILHDPHGPGFFIHVGPSNSGKTTTLELVLDLWGDDYACMADPATFERAVRRSGSDHRADEARFVSKRAVLCDEAQDSKIDTTRMKTKARRHRSPVRDAYARGRDMVEPQVGTYILTANVAPKFTYTDKAWRNRVRVIKDEHELPDPDGWREIVKAWIAQRLPDWRANLLEEAVRSHGRVSRTEREAADLQALDDETDPVQADARKAATLALDGDRQQFQWWTSSDAIEVHVRAISGRLGLSRITDQMNGLTKEQLKNRLPEILRDIGGVNVRTGKGREHGWKFIRLRPMEEIDRLVNEEWLS